MSEMRCISEPWRGAGAAKVMASASARRATRSARMLCADRDWVRVRWARVFGALRAGLGWERADTWASEAGMEVCAVSRPKH